MASYREKNGTWYFRIVVPDEMGNRRQIERKGGATRKEAEIACLKLQAVVEYNRTMYLPENITIDTMLAQWLKDYAEPNLKTNTYATYESMHKRIISEAIGGMKLAKVTPMLAQRFINSITPNYSRSTVNTLLSMLRLSFRHAVTICGYINTNPFDNVRIPRTHKKKRQRLPFTPDQIEEVLTHFRAEQYNIYLAALISYHTGLRLGEVLGLSWNAIDMDNDMLTVQQIMIRTNELQDTPKTKSSHRTIPFDIMLHDVLHAEKQRQMDMRNKVLYNYNTNNLVCVGDHGQPVSYLSVRAKFKSCAFRLYGDGYSFHSIRHLHATLLLENGEELEAVSKRMGHANINITAGIYSHILDKRNKKMQSSLNALFSAKGTI